LEHRSGEVYTPYILDILGGEMTNILSTTDTNIEKLKQDLLDAISTGSDLAIAKARQKLIIEKLKQDLLDAAISTVGSTQAIDEALQRLISASIQNIYSYVLALFVRETKNGKLKLCGSAVCAEINNRKFVITSSHAHKDLQEKSLDGNFYYCSPRGELKSLPIEETLHCAKTGITPGLKDDHIDVTVYRVSDEFVYNFIPQKKILNTPLCPQEHDIYIFIGFPYSQNKKFSLSQLRRQKKKLQVRGFYATIPANFDFKKYGFDPSINIVAVMSNRITKADGTEDNLIGSMGVSGGLILRVQTIISNLELNKDIVGIAIENFDADNKRYLVSTQSYLVIDKIINWLNQSENANDTR